MVDLTNPGRFVFYVNFRTEADVDGLGFAIAEQMFTFSQLIEDSSNYLITIERFRVPLQAIPMQDARTAAVSLQPKIAGPGTPFDTTDSFSIKDYFDQLNGKQAGLVFSLTSDGRVLIDYDNFAVNNILLDPVIAQVFDMDVVVGAGLNGPGQITGGTPIFDRFDNLHKIQIEAQTGLSSLQQEIVSTAVFANLLTDFLVPNNVNFSYIATPGQANPVEFNVNYDVRQDLEFNSASDRRFIMLKGNAPIQNIRLEVSAITRDGRRRRIRLAPRSILEIKLAFWKKS